MSFVDNSFYGSVFHGFEMHKTGGKGIPYTVRRTERVGSKAADVKNRKRPMLKQPMLLKAADVA